MAAAMDHRMRQLEAQGLSGPECVNRMASRLYLRRTTLPPRPAGAATDRAEKVALNQGGEWLDAARRRGSGQQGARRARALRAKPHKPRRAAHM